MLMIIGFRWRMCLCHVYTMMLPCWLCCRMPQHRCTFLYQSKEQQGQAVQFDVCLLLVAEMKLWEYIYIWCLWNGYNLLWWCTVAGFFKEKVKHIYVKSSCCNYRFVMMFHPRRLSNSYSSYEYLCFWAFQLRGILNFPSYILHYIRNYIYIYIHI